MKKPEEYIKDFWGTCEGRKISDYDVALVIKQAQIDAINAAVNRCAESAEMHGYYNEPCKAEGIRLKRFKRIWKNRLFKVETNISIDKQSILSVADELKNELLWVRN